MKKEIKVKEDISAIRLDIYLKKELSEYSREKIKKWIKNKQILVNNKEVKPNFLLKGGEIISLDIEEEEKKELIPLLLSPEPKILYEDENFLGIDKPPGVIVHPNFKNLNQPTIASWLIYRWPFLRKVGEDPLRPGIVHRLDKETSGVLVVCKNNKSFDHLKTQFKKRLVEKEYIVLVKGTIPFKKGEINLPLARSKKSPLKRKIVLGQKTGNEKIKPALTTYQVIKKYQNFTLLKVFPKTGRTHQIRVHLSAIGFPVVGDSLYGKDKTKISPRLFLHARKISFWGLDQEKIEIISPLPKDLKEILKKLNPLEES